MRLGLTLGTIDGAVEPRMRVMNASCWVVGTALGHIDGTVLGVVEGTNGSERKGPMLLGPVLGTIDGDIEHKLGRLVSGPNHGVGNLDEDLVPQGETSVSPSET
jgi:hypothetical protein